MLETARREGNCFVRINSILPPLAELEESVWDEILGSESARRESYVRMLRAEAQLDGLMRRWPCVIFSQRPDFSMQFVSPNIEELTGIAAANWSRQPQQFWQVVHELDVPELQQQFKRAVRTGAEITNTYRIKHAVSGQVSYVLEHRHPTISQNGLLLGYGKSCTAGCNAANSRGEASFHCPAWKETLAELTLGMAHDFRNIMAGIHSLSETYLSQVDDRHPFHEGLNLIQKNSLQASQLVQRMINLHLGQTGERSYQNMNEVVTDVAELVKKILPRRIRVETELSDESLPVYVDLVELRQVIINLMLNAADAMPQGGILTLETSRHGQMPEVKNMKGTLPRPPCVCLSIQDTGCGIKERHLSSIFDPFFTTKSKGSGLGLYNARIAVEKHQGAISVESRESIENQFENPGCRRPIFRSPDRETETAQLKRAAVAAGAFLLLGQAGEMLDKAAEFLALAINNTHIVTAIETGGGLAEMLHSGNYHFAGAMLLAEPNAPSLNSLLDEVRVHFKVIKVVLKLSGCSQDSLDGGLAKGVDLVLSSDVSHAEMLERLESFLS